MHPLLRYVLIATPLCAVVFLVSSGFFYAWDGQVVSQRPSPEEDPAALRVLIVGGDGSTTEQDWSADLVRELKLRVDATGLPPTQIPPNAARSTKPRFGTFFTVTPSGEEARTIYPSMAGPVSLTGILWVLGLLLHNMLRSGSPFSWEPRGVAPVPTQPHGVSVPQGPASTPSRPQQGPPPGKPRRGRGRRD